MPANSLPSPAQHSAAPCHSWFDFRSERASWLSVLGLIVAIVSLTFAAIYAVDTFRLARWTSEKDYQAYCQSLLSTSQALPPDCLRVVHATLGPPPFHTLDYFTVLVDKIKRLVAGPPQQNDTDHKSTDHPGDNPDMMSIVTASIIQAYSFVKLSTQKPLFRRWDRRYSFRVAIISAACLPALLLWSSIWPAFMKHQITGDLGVGHVLMLFTAVVSADKVHFSYSRACTELLPILLECVFVANLLVWMRDSEASSRTILIATVKTTFVFSLIGTLWLSIVLWPDFIDRSKSTTTLSRPGTTDELFE